MLLTSLFVISMVGIVLAFAAIVVGLHNVKNKADVLKQQALLVATVEAHGEAMLQIATAMEVLNGQQEVCNSNIQKLSQGLNALAKTRASDNIATMLAQIPSELLPQA